MYSTDPLTLTLSRFSYGSRGIEWLLWNVRELYREVPGLALTADEVAETFQLDAAKADAVLMALVDTRVLVPPGRLLRLEHSGEPTRVALSAVARSRTPCRRRSQGS